MKKIVLAPIKNEGWILETFLKNISFADHIILADQNSSDNTKDILSKYPNITCIKNEFEGHSNKIRWALLHEARKIPGDKLIFCLDADEIISKEAFEWTIAKAEDQLQANSANTQAQASLPLRFSYAWIQLCSDIHKYRNDGVWQNNTRAIAFTDFDSHEKVEYNRQEVINDHTDRLPISSNQISLDCPHPVLHLHFLAENRSYIKQAWYMCQELIKRSPQSPITQHLSHDQHSQAAVSHEAKTQNLPPSSLYKKINFQYSGSLIVDTKKLLPTPEDWLADIDFPETSVFMQNDNIRLSEIFALFETYGVLFFEGLDIWNNQALAEYFTEHTGKKPHPQKFNTLAINIYQSVPTPIKRMLKYIKTKII